MFIWFGKKCPRDRSVNCCWTTTGGGPMHTQHSPAGQDRYFIRRGKSWNNFGLGITKLLLQRLMGFKYLSLACFIYILFCKSHKVQDQDSSSRRCDPAWSSLVSRTSAIIARSYRRACHRVPDFVWTLNNFWNFTKLLSWPVRDQSDGGIKSLAGAPPIGSLVTCKLLKLTIKPQSQVSESSK